MMMCYLRIRTLKLYRPEIHAYRPEIYAYDHKYMRTDHKYMRTGQKYVPVKSSSPVVIETVCCVHRDLPAI